MVRVQDIHFSQCVVLPVELTSRRILSRYLFQPLRRKFGYEDRLEILQQMISCVAVHLGHNSFFSRIQSQDEYEYSAGTSLHFIGAEHGYRRAARRARSCHLYNAWIWSICLWRPDYLGLHLCPHPYLHPYPEAYQP